MIDNRKLKDTMDRLGYEERYSGTRYIRSAVSMIDRDREAMMCKDIYPGIAAMTGGSAARIERAMRSATENAMRSINWRDEWGNLGGWGRPNNSEVIRRLARECSDAD